MNEEKNSYKQIVQMIILLSCIKATEMKENRNETPMFSYYTKVIRYPMQESTLHTCGVFMLCPNPIQIKPLLHPQYLNHLEM